MATEKHPLKESSRALLALLLSPGSARTPLLDVEEIKEILESHEPESPSKDGKATARSSHSDDTPL
jgi:hypothetical protein